MPGRHKPLLQLSVLTWNARGFCMYRDPHFVRKRQFLGPLIRNVDIVFVQEAHVRFRDLGALRRFATDYGFKLYTLEGRVDIELDKPRISLGSFVLAKLTIERDYTVEFFEILEHFLCCLLYTSPSPRDRG